MLPGVYLGTKKDGTIYYRSSITYHNKHISLGSYQSERQASQSYREACLILFDYGYTLDYDYSKFILLFEKIITLLNFRDNQMYIKCPIYLRKNYFQYFYSPTLDFKFDNDDLFYFSSKKIMKRNGHLFVADYGMQVSLLSRYGIKNYAIKNRDYRFSNNDETDLRRSNIIILSRYNGVTAIATSSGIFNYKAYIHLHGNFNLGTFTNEDIAGIAYNKAVDLALRHGVKKLFTVNFIDTLSSKEYAHYYTEIKLPKRFSDYLKRTYPPMDSLQHP